MLQIFRILLLNLFRLFLFNFKKFYLFSFENFFYYIFVKFNFFHLNKYLQIKFYLVILFQMLSKNFLQFIKNSTKINWKRCLSSFLNFSFNSKLKSKKKQEKPSQIESNQI